MIYVDYNNMYYCFDHVTNLFDDLYYINDFQFRKSITRFSVYKQTVKKKNWLLRLLFRRIRGFLVVEKMINMRLIAEFFIIIKIHV